MRKSGYCGVRGGMWWRTGGMNLLFAVFCSHCFFYLAPAFHFYSPDVDECANQRSCPEHSTCHNSLGSYSCVCNPGFQSRSGKKSFQGRGEMCEGICRGLLGNPVQCVCKDRNGEKLRWRLGEFKALICKAETNSNWFIHAFIQQTLLEHLLYAKHYSRDGGYCDNTEKNIYSAGTSYHGERIRQQTKYNHVFGLFAADGLTFFHAVTVVLAQLRARGSSLEGAHSQVEGSAGCWLGALPELGAGRLSSSPCC